MEYLTNYLFNEIKSSTFKLYLFYIYIKLKIIFKEKILFEKIIINILVFFFMNQTLHHDKMSALIIFIKYIIGLFVDVIYPLTV